MRPKSRIGPPRFRSSVRAEETNQKNKKNHTPDHKQTEEQNKKQIYLRSTAELGPDPDPEKAGIYPRDRSKLRNRSKTTLQIGPEPNANPA